MNNNKIEEFMNATLDKLKSIIKTETVVGEPFVTADKSVIVPISKISFGFLSGGGEYSESNPKVKENDYPLAGGGAAGVSIKPLGFLVSNMGTHKIITLDNTITDTSRWSDILCNAVNKLVKEE